MPTVSNIPISDLVAQLREALEKVDKTEWKRADTTVYASEHHGWRRGEELFRNRLTCSVYVDNNAPQEEAVASAAFIVLAHNHLAQILADWQRMSNDQANLRDLFGEGEYDERKTLTENIERLIELYKD